MQKSNELSKFPSVKSFLDSIRHSSIKSMKSYASALVHLQDFLDKRYSSNDNQGYNCETILKPLIENKISIYELFDGFVSYMLSKIAAVTNSTTTISTSSIIFYLAAIRSYFAYHDIDVIPSKFKRKVKIPREDEQPLDIEITAAYLRVHDIIETLGNIEKNSKEWRHAIFVESTLSTWAELTNALIIS